FLQIENSLRDAVELCARHPELPMSQRYDARLRQVAQALVELTAEADRLYLTWRAAMTLRMLAGKDLWRRFERIRDELGEYGVDPSPKGRYNYWEGDLLREGTRELLAFLSASDLPEAADWRAELDQALGALDARAREERRGLEDYKRAAPLRRQAI